MSRILRSIDIKGALKSKQRGFIMRPSRFATGGAGDPLFASVQTLLHFEGSFNDSSSFARTTTHIGSVAISTVPKFGANDGFFPNNTSRINIASLGTYTNNWCVEMWVRPSTVAGFNIFWGGNNILWGRNGADLYMSITGTVRSGAGSLITTAAFQHVALSVDTGNNWRMFLNGLQQGTTLNKSVSQAFGSTWVGNNVNVNNTNGMLARIDEFRITVGDPRYTANFTPPTAAFPDSL